MCRSYQHAHQILRSSFDATMLVSTETASKRWRTPFGKWGRVLRADANVLKLFGAHLLADFISTLSTASIFYFECHPYRVLKKHLGQAENSNACKQSFLWSERHPQTYSVHLLQTFSRQATFKHVPRSRTESSRCCTSQQRTVEQSHQSF